MIPLKPILRDRRLRTTALIAAAFMPELIPTVAIVGCVAAVAGGATVLSYRAARRAASLAGTAIKAAWSHYNAPRLKRQQEQRQQEQAAREAHDRPSKLKEAAADARRTYDLRVALIKTSGVDPVESHAAQEHAKQQRVKTLTEVIDQC